MSDLCPLNSAGEPFSGINAEQEVVEVALRMAEQTDLAHSQSAVSGLAVGGGAIGDMSWW